jgi:pantothenate kinase
MPHRLPQLLTNPIAHLLQWLGSGKSTVVAQLADAVNAQAGAGSMVALGMDGFHLTRAQLAQFPDPAAAFERRGSPWTFDPQALGQRLLDLRSGAAVGWPGFEHGVGDPVADAVWVAPSTRLVLVEGLYLLHKGHGWDLAHQFDERWFLDVTMDVAMNRLIARHMAANGHSREVAQARLARNDRLNAQIVWQSRGAAQWLLENAER